MKQEQIIHTNIKFDLKNSNSESINQNVEHVQSDLSHIIQGNKYNLELAQLNPLKLILFANIFDANHILIYLFITQNKEQNPTFDKISVGFCLRFHGEQMKTQESPPQGRSMVNQNT